MKVIVTLVLVLFIGMSAQAQKANEEIKAATVTMGIENNNNCQEFSSHNTNSVARLYMFKNSKIKKELSFSTKLNKAKLA